MSRWRELEERIREVDADVQKMERLLQSPSISEERRSHLRRRIDEVKRREEQVMREAFAMLTAWDKVLLARHVERPYTLDYIGLLFSDFVELHGDRRFGDDPAVVAGLASLNGHAVAVIGHQKGRDVRERQYRNFGSARPEGYRKAARVMQFAERLRLPVLSFVDTPAAESRLEAEERGIANAIAENLLLMSQLRTPIVVTIIGEGGSGGAIGIGVGDHVMMLEHAMYSVIPPESCAVILSAFGRDASRGPEAAEALRLTAQETLKLGAVDEVVREPLGGAHRDPTAAAATLKEALLRALARLRPMPTDELVAARYAKLRGVGHYVEG
jgi:acetyl-CoA carboxylase carboxyl transferase subunit alpha